MNLRGPFFLEAEKVSIGSTGRELLGAEFCAQGRATRLQQVPRPEKFGEG